MKKITAIICSLIMTCTVFASCGDSSSSSSKADTTAATTTTAAVAEDSSDAQSTTDTTADSNVETATGDTLAAKYTQALSNQVFSLDMTVTSDYTGEMPMVLQADGTNYYISMNLMGMAIDMYLIDNQMYMMDSSSKSYSVTSMDSADFNLEDEGVSSFGLNDSYKFVSSETTDDGLICETYSIDESSLMGEIELGSGVTLETESTSETDSESTSYAKYYFDAATEQLKKIEMSTMGMNESIVINSFSTDDVKIELPDLTDWTLMDMSAVESEVTDEITAAE